MSKQRNPELLHAAFAGLVAITVNMLFLKAAPILHIKAESGGLLRLTLKLLPVTISSFPFMHSTLFWVLCHYLTGYVLVFVYHCYFDRDKELSGWLKGALFSILPWFINAFVLLPLLGQPVLGLGRLPLSGILYHFLANLIFGVILGWLDDVFTPNFQLPFVIKDEHW